MSAGGSASAMAKRTLYREISRNEDDKAVASGWLHIQRLDVVYDLLEWDSLSCSRALSHGAHPCSNAPDQERGSAKLVITLTYQQGC